MLYKLQGIVLKGTKLNDSDKIITIFTKEQGKVQAVAKGVRNPKSKLVGSTETFSLSDFVLYKGKNLYNVNQGDVIDSYYPLREDLKKLAYASYIVELVNSGVVEEESNTKIFGLLVKTLNLIMKETKYRQIVRAFELKFISYLGYRPHLINCVNCHEDLNDNIKFSINHSGVLCEKCRGIDRYGNNINIEIANIMKFLLFSSFENILEIEIEDNILKKIENILSLYISKNIDKTYFNSLKFINAVED
ncbi:DNA repair protein RecO [Clostridium sp. D2Q-11]|uniref:DNA repair protein RecO n=1 Tax=Anaeromonas frigoriresistens TaxID=2683708 RepID=A0A942UQW6_9FIRM|nr:DNA repair protein RecO [Anaeromonas frigoriresistens]MBS4536908.1 DNA repair protein RecO [Anaeromonas frigoriresistens]